eukprot:g3525.t1
MSFTNAFIDALESPWFRAFATASLIIGSLQIAKFAYSTVSSVLKQFVTPVKNLRSYGQWAVVTGATDGIGKAYCLELAKRGLNICLLSRTPDRLAKAAREIEESHGVQTERLAVDFSNVSSELWSEIKAKLESIEVGVLINNVGCSYDHYEFLHLIDDETVHRLIEINIRATVEMTRIVLPGMIDRKKGVIINIGSGVGSLLPCSPLLAVYAGTKSFVEQFTKSCYLEYKDQGIVFQDQAPLFVATKMSKIRRANLSAPSPEIWVKGAIRKIGTGPLTAGYWVHNFMWMIMSKIPESILNSYVFSSGKKMRSKALRKKELSRKKE